MPERQPAPGETDDHGSSSEESPVDAGPAPNRPPARPVMPSPKPRPSAGAGVDATAAVGAVGQRDAARPDPGEPGAETHAAEAEQPTASTTPSASSSRPETPPPAGSESTVAVPPAEPTAAVPSPAARPTPAPREHPATTDGTSAGDPGVPQAPGAHERTEQVRAEQVRAEPSAGPAPQPPAVGRTGDAPTAVTRTDAAGTAAGATAGAATAGSAPTASDARGTDVPPAAAEPEDLVGHPGEPEPVEDLSSPEPGPDPVIPQPVTPRPVTEQPGPRQSGAPQSGAPQSGTAQSGTAQPGTAQPGTAQPGTPQQRETQPGGAGLFTPHTEAGGPVAETARVAPVPPSRTDAPRPGTPAGQAPGAAPGRPAEQDRAPGDQPTRPSATGAAAAGTAATAWAPGRDTRPQADVPGSSESTQILRPVGSEQREPVTERIPLTAAAGRGPDDAGPGDSGPGGPGGSDGTGSGDGRPRRRGLLVVAGVVAVLVLAYLGDLLFSSGSVPRGVVVAGQEIGGLSRAAAIERLQSAIEPRSSQPVQVTAGEVRSEVDPRAAGLAVDYDGTLDEAGSQPLNPFTRIASFFGTRDVPVVNKADERSVRTAMEQLAPVVDRDPKDGTVRFEGLNPVPVAPEPGQRLDVESAIGTLEQQWATGTPVALPLIVEQPATTPEDVQKAIDEVARPAVSAPVTVTGEGANGTVRPEDVAEALTFKADPNASPKLVPQINVESLTDVVKPQLASTEKPAVDASLNLAVTPAAVVPSQDGRGIDYKATFGNLVPVLTGTGARSVPAVYAPTQPDLTTQEIQSLGNAVEISSFTTGGFARDSGVNIRRAAEAIDGTIVAPGETFSLDDATNPRDASRGYVEAGIIEDGAPSRGVGGGVSQLATTLYNASYFAGMVDVEHKEHSFYISRYPPGREATVFDNIIDLKFRNDGPTPVLIRTAWTPGDITVKFLGQKMYEVSSQTGPRTNPTSPQVVQIPPGRPCSPSKGAPGFTVTDTKTTRNIQTGETTSRTRTVRYNPSPIVQCG